MVDNYIFIKDPYLFNESYQKTQSKFIQEEFERINNSIRNLSQQDYDDDELMLNVKVFMGFLMQNGPLELNSLLMEIIHEVRNTNFNPNHLQSLTNNVENQGRRYSFPLSFRLYTSKCPSCNSPLVCFWIEKRQGQLNAGQGHRPQIVIKCKVLYIHDNQEYEYYVN